MLGTCVAETRPFPVGVRFAVAAAGHAPIRVAVLIFATGIVGAAVCTGVAPAHTLPVRVELGAAPAR